MNRKGFLSVTCAAGSVLALASAVASAGTFKTITIDGNFADWADVPVLATDPAEGVPIDFNTVQIANDAEKLYLRITYHTPVNPNAAGSGNTNLAFDLDNNKATGFDVYGLGLIGSELGFANDYPFSQANNQFNSGRSLSAGAAIAPFNYGNPADEFSSQEYSIPRNLAFTDNGQLAFGNSFGLLVYAENASGETTNAIAYTFGALTTGWSSGGSGDYNVPSNWSNNAVPNSIDAVAEFGTSIIKPETVYSNLAVTAGTLRFNNPNMYVLAGAGSMTLDVSSGSATIDVLAGSQKINLPLRLNDTTTATVASGATLTIADPLTLANGSTLNKTGAGTMEIISTVSTVGGAASISTAAGTTNLRYAMGAGTSLVSSGGETRTFTTQRVNAVTVNGGTVAIDSTGAARVLVTSALTISAGSLNVGDNGLVVQGGSTAAIRALIASGRAVGGTGLVTTASTAGRGLGYASSTQILNPTSFLGETFAGPAVLVRYTLLGDTNLNGGVGFEDLVSLAQNYNGTSREWYQGDFNYDGTVNFADLVSLAQNYNGTVGSAQLSAIGGADFAADWALAQTLVPEPASLLALGTVATLAGRRRR